MIRESLAWQRTSIMGLATLCNLAFATIDMLMLGVMSNPQQVGLYSAAYRVVNQVLYTYYLLTLRFSILNWPGKISSNGCEC